MAAKIVCGWCGHATAPERCGSCGRDPAVPWIQRAQDPPAVRTDAAGRPVLDAATIRHRLAEARSQLEADGLAPTVEALAERLEVSVRTVRRWREMAG